MEAKCPYGKRAFNRRECAYCGNNFGSSCLFGVEAEAITCPHGLEMFDAESCKSCKSCVKPVENQSFVQMFCSLGVASKAIEESSVDSFGSDLEKLFGSSGEKPCPMTGEKRSDDACNGCFNQIDGGRGIEFCKLEDPFIDHVYLEPPSIDSSEGKDGALGKKVFDKDDWLVPDSLLCPLGREIYYKSDCGDCEFRIDDGSSEYCRGFDELEV